MNTQGPQILAACGPNSVSLGNRPDGRGDFILPDFVKQSLVADLQLLGCLLAIPVSLLQSRLTDRFRGR